MSAASHPLIHRTDVGYYIYWHHAQRRHQNRTLGIRGCDRTAVVLLAAIFQPLSSRGSTTNTGGSSAACLRTLTTNGHFFLLSISTTTRPNTTHNHQGVIKYSLPVCFKREVLNYPQPPLQYISLSLSLSFFATDQNQIKQAASKSSSCHAIFSAAMRRPPPPPRLLTLYCEVPRPNLNFLLRLSTTIRSNDHSCIWLRIDDILFRPSFLHRHFWVKTSLGRGKGKCKLIFIKLVRI